MQPGEGERRAIGGYYPQYRIAASLILRHLQNDTLQWIRLADPEVGRVDDLQIGSHARVDAFQVKWHTYGGNFTFNDLKASSGGDPSLISQLAHGWHGLRAKYTGQRVVVHLVTNATPSTADARGIPVGTVPPTPQHFAAFIEQVWKPAKNTPQASAVSIPGEWRDAWEALKNASGLSTSDFETFIYDCELEFNYCLPGTGEGNTYDDSIMLQDLKDLTETLFGAVADPQKIIELTKDELLVRLNWQARFEFRSRHEFPINELLYQPIEHSVNQFEQSLNTLPGGYIAVLGPSGSGKSSLLTQTLRKRTERVIRYYAYIPDAQDPITVRGESVSFLHDVVLALKHAGFSLDNISASSFDRDQLLQHLHRQLQKLHKDWQVTGRKTIILIDGLDHISREQHPSRSLLYDLPQPEQVPEGIFFVLGSQTDQLIGLPAQVQYSIRQESRRIEMQHLPRKAVLEIIERMTFSPDLSNEQKSWVYTLSSGHPLALASLLQRLADASDIVEQQNILDMTEQYEEDMERRGYTQYMQALFQYYQRIDFRGIKIDTSISINIYLADVFVFPEFQGGVPKHETLERNNEEHSNLKETQQKRDLNDEDDKSLSDIEQSSKGGVQFTLQREKLQDVLANNRQLIILGDPGSGKSTLLQYILLQSCHEKETFARAFPQLAHEWPIVPLYIPLANFAEMWSTNPPGERSLKNFIFKYLQDCYLDAYYIFIYEQLERGRVFMLLDGLDEIVDERLRIQVAKHIDLFTNSYSKNRFIVTSRIVSYKTASLTGDYQEYTLADFNKAQIKTFTQNWFLAYEKWLKEAERNQSPKRSLKKEFAPINVNSLFEKIQREPTFKRLTTNPLLLTILALLQHEETELPNRRVELFELYTTTLLETWIKAKGQSTSLSKREMIDILRPLAFWMHEHSKLGFFSEEELHEQIMKQLLEQNFSKIDAAKKTDDFLLSIRETVGIIVKKAKNSYGFLHLAFEEYFAALELVKRKDEVDFIRSHMHDPQWREVIILTVEIASTLRNGEHMVTNLIQNVILPAQSHFEQYLHRDLLLAATCLVDIAGVTIACEDEIIKRILILYITIPYSSLLKPLSKVLRSWRGTRVGRKAMTLIIEFLNNNVEIFIQKTKHHSELFSNISQFETEIFGYYDSLVQQYQETQFKLLRLRTIIPLRYLQVDITTWRENALTMLSDLDWRIRQAALEVLEQMGVEDQPTINKLLGLLSDPVWQVRATTVRVLSQLKDMPLEILNTILALISDHNWQVRKAVAEGLSKVGKENPKTLEAVYQLIDDSAWNVRWNAIEALANVRSKKAQVIDVLLKLLSNSDSHIKLPIVKILSKIGSNQPYVVDVLFQLLSSPDSEVRSAAAEALKEVGQGQPRVVHALLQLLSTSNIDTQGAVVKALGEAGNEQSLVINSLLKILPDCNDQMKCEIAETLGQIGNGYSEVSDALFILLLDTDERVRITAIRALGQIGNESPKVLNLLVDLLSDPAWRIRSTAARTIGQIGYVNSEALNALLDLLSSSNNHVKAAVVSALAQIGNREPRVLDALLKNLPNPRSSMQMRQVMIRTLGQIGGGHPSVADALLYLHSNPRNMYLHPMEISLEKRMMAKALGQINSKHSQVFEALLDILNDSEYEVRYAAAKALGELGSNEPQVIERLLNLASRSDSYNLAQNVEKYSQHLEIHSKERQIQLLGLVGPDSPQAIQVLLQYLTASNTVIRQAATIALGQVEDERADVFDTLIGLLADRDFQVRNEVVRAVAKVGIRNPRTVKILIDFLSSLPDPNVSYGEEQIVVEALERMRDTHPELIDDLLNFSSHQSEKVRVTITKTLGRIGSSHPRILEVLFKLLADPKWTVSYEAARSLGQVGRKQHNVCNALLHLLATADLSLKPVVITALGHIGDGSLQVLNTLLNLLTDSNVSTRSAATKALGEVGHQSLETLGPLLKLLDDPDAHVRKTAIVALGRLGKGDALVVDTLFGRLVNTDSIEREDIIAALGNTGINLPHILDAMMKIAISDASSHEKKNAVLAIFKVDNEQNQAAEIIIRLLSDSDDWEMKLTAAEMINILRIDRLKISSYIKGLLERHKLYSSTQLVADEGANILLYALQQIVEAP